MDLGSTVLKLTLSLSDQAGEAIATDDKTAPINNIANSLFSQVSVSLKNTTISHPNPHYGYRAYLENLLNYSTEAKKTWLTYEGFYQDQAENFDTETNTGLLARKALFAGGRKCELVTRLHCDINFQKNLVPSNLDIKYILTPARQEFVMQNFTAEKTFNIKIESAKLIVRKVKLTPEKALSFEKEIAKDGLRLPIDFVKMQTFTISAGLKSFEKTAFFSGNLPEHCVFGFISNTAHNGTFGTNPFNFKHFDLTQVQFRCNGRPIPTQPLQVDFGTKNVYEGYTSLYSGLGRQYFDTSNSLSLADYVGGNALYAINFNSNTNCPHDDLAKTGTVDISLKFGTALPAPTTLIVYSSNNAAILIDRFRNVILEE